MQYASYRMFMLVIVLYHISNLMLKGSAGNFILFLYLKMN